MQALEASLSLLVFASIVPLALSAMQEPAQQHPLYRLQLAEDAWRVLYIRGDFEDFGKAGPQRIRTDMETITGAAGLCVFLNGSAEYTSCRGGEYGHEMTITIRRTIIIGGKPKSVSFSLGK